jgi:adenylate kinase
VSLNLILYGAPGSGKGTQADSLRAKYGIPHISTGDILRAEMAAGTELGLEAKPIYDRGDLVPDEIMIGIIKSRLSQADCERGFILDGFPRTIPQAEALDRMMREIGRRFDRIIYLTVDAEELVERLSDRWICPKCGRTYSKRANPPAEGNRCPIDGAELYQREDDKPEAARHRIDVYLEQTLPVLDHYRPSGLVVEVDGTGEIEEVSRRIEAVLGGEAAA